MLKGIFNLRRMILALLKNTPSGEVTSSSRGEFASSSFHMPLHIGAGGVPQEADPYIFLACCAPASSGKASSPRVRVTMRPMVLIRISTSWVSIRRRHLIILVAR